MKHDMSLRFRAKEKQLRRNAKILLKDIFGFATLKEARQWLIDHSKDGYCILKKDGVEVFYASNCRPGYKFQMGGNHKGIFVSTPF